MRLATLFRERRRTPREACDRPARVKIGDLWYDTAVDNLSSGGAALRTRERPIPNSQVLVEIADLGYFLCRVIRHLDEGIAVKFERATFPLAEEAAEDAR